MGLADTFQNRINLVFFHLSFIFIKIKYKNQNNKCKIFYQKMFDFTFRSIEINMREIGYGDVTVNKNMKELVRIFYNILLNCENYNEMNIDDKKKLFNKQLKQITSNIGDNNSMLIEYFDKYKAFCLDLSIDSVIKGELNFKIK